MARQAALSGPVAPPTPRWRGVGRALEPWLYLTPALLLLVLVMLVPLLVGLSYAFRSMQLQNPFATGWVGLANFDELVHDPDFYGALLNTVIWTVGSLVLQFVLGLGLALLLRAPFAGRRLVQSIVFVPWAVPVFLTGLTWAWLLNPTIGPLPHWLAALGMLNEPRNILADPDLALLGPIVANVWFGVPFFAMTLLAALKAIPDELYEAAAIDGANGPGQFRHVTLPLLSSTIAVTILLRTIWIANFADLIFVMTGGGPANATQTVATYIFTTAYSRLDFGYASAIAMALLVLLILYTVLLVLLRRDLIGGSVARA
jgi:multiple sugar transport system permease protein